MRAGSRALVQGAALALLVRAASADVFVVNNNLDTAAGLCPANPTTLGTVVGTCSLRSAIAEANLTPDADVILFAPAVFATPASKLIPVATKLPDLSGTVEINGVASGLVTQRVQGIVLRATGGNTELLKVLSGNALLGDIALEGGTLAVQGSSRLVFDQSVDASFAQAIGGTGTLVKQGTARLVLGGTNAYGDTRIDTGTLQGDTLSIPGPGRQVQDSGLLVFDQEAADPQDFFGAINGSGRVQKIGAGTLYLRTANSYVGGTLVSAGTLQGFAGSTPATSSLQGDIANDAILVFEQTSAGSFAGAITGGGQLVKLGAGDLTLTGANRFSGGTLLSAGRLIGNANAIPATVSLTAGTELVFDQAGSGLHGGGISGAGAVVKQGTGTLTLGGVNSYTGSTRILAGTLVGSTQSLVGALDVAAGTTLAFDQSFTGSFAGLIGGAGTLEKRGSGVLRLTADHSAGGGFLGTTAVRGGRLEIGGPASALLPGEARIFSGAALGGIGSLGGLAIAHSGGAISPGSSVGVLQGVLQVGSASFEAGSFFEVDVTPTTADALLVAGAASITPGAQLRILPEPGEYPAAGAGTPMTILDAGSLMGAFDEPQDFAFLDVTLSQTPTAIQLLIETNGNTLSNLAETSNQREVAQALETAQAGSGPDPDDLDEVFAELNPLLASDVPAALDAMTGEQLTEFATARLAVGSRLHGAIQERIRGASERPGEALLGGGPAAPAGFAGPAPRGPLAGLALATATGATGLAAAMAMQDMGPLLASPPSEAGFGSWLDGYGIFGDVSGTAGTDDFDTTIWGVSAGVDTRFAERWIAGLAGGYARSELDFDGLAGDAHADTAQGAAYAGYVSPLFEVGADFRFAWNGMHATRDIDFPPPSTLTRSADSDFDGIDLGGHAEAALNLWEGSGLVVQPVASLSYAHLQQDSFEETGAGSLSIDADEQDIDSVVSGVGARVRGRFELGEELWLHPELRARWLHEFGDTERKLEARIGGVPGATYSVRGAEIGRDAGSFGIAWTVTRAGNLHVFAEYDVAVNAELLQQSAAVGVRILW